MPDSRALRRPASTTVISVAALFGSVVLAACADGSDEPEVADDDGEDPGDGDQPAPDADAGPRSQASDPQGFDHWHAAYGFYLCDTFVRTDPPPADVGEDALGIHTHEDAVVHIHPFIDAAAGSNATLGVFLDQIDVEMTDDTLTFPDGEVWEEGETRCDGADGRLVLARWDDAGAVDSDPPDELVTEDFAAVRFRRDLEAYTIAFLPDGVDEVPAHPDTIESLEGLTDVLEPPDLGGE